MVDLVNRVKQTTGTTGDGTIVLGSAVAGYQTFDDAGATGVVRYVIEDGNDWEIGAGTLNGDSMSRVLSESSTDSLLDLSGNAVVFATAAAEDIQQRVSIGDLDMSDNDILRAGLVTGDGSMAVDFNTPNALLIGPAGAAPLISVNPPSTTIGNKIKFTYVNYNNVGSAGIVNSHQVSSVMDTAAGSFEVYFSLPFQTATYAPAGMANTNLGTQTAAISFNGSTGIGYETGKCGHVCEDLDGPYRDYLNNCVMYVGG